MDKYGTRQPRYTDCVATKLRPGEAEELRRRAIQEGVTASEWVRGLVLDAISRTA